MSTDAMSEQSDIPLTESNSTAIIGYGYDPASKTLVLKFNGGRTYRYADVPAATYADLKDAKSIGTFFSKRINGKFKAI